MKIKESNASNGNRLSMQNYLKFVFITCKCIFVQSYSFLANSNCAISKSCPGSVKKNFQSNRWVIDTSGSNRNPGDSAARELLFTNKVYS